MVKTEVPEKPGIEFSTHKDRSEWFRERISYPLRDAHPGLLEDYWRHKIGTEVTWFPWKSAGPFNIAGRVTALVVDPKNDQRLYAGAATGGVWRSTDGGRHWSTGWPRWINSNIGALAIDPFDPKRIYAGTGESNMSADTYPGSGLYLSTDGGNKWEPLAGAEQCALPRRIAALAVHPYIPGGKVLYLGGVSHDPTMPAGLYSSTDGGLNWDREMFFSERNYLCHSIVFHPDGLIFAAINARGSRNGVWRRTDKGWEQLTSGPFTADQFGRISLAIAPSRPDTIYALASDWRGQRALGVFCSRNKGEKWERIDHNCLKKQVQMSYNNAIAVHPENEDFVVCGGNDLFLTSDAGTHWIRASHWNGAPPQYVHADQHAIVMPGGKLIYSGNDGGVAASADLGVSWERRDRGMATTMFYDVAVAPSNSSIFGGGTQDNGTLIAGVEGKPGDFLYALGGDGAWMVIDAGDDHHIFGSSQNISISRHVRRGRWARKFWKNVTPANMTKTERRQVAIARMTMDRKSIWVGAKRLWQTTNSGKTWQHVSPFFDGSVITAIEVAAANRDVIFVGTTNGGIFRSVDAGATWSANLAGPEIPGKLISHIETHPQTAGVVVATVAGSGRVAKVVPHVAYGMEASAPQTEPFRHIYLSKDGGLTWRPVDSPGMPDVAFHSAAFETKLPHRLFVSGDCGVWMTANDTEWVDLTAGLPTVIVSGLVYHPDGILTAATYGRGIWRLRVPAPPKKQASIFASL